MPTFDTLALGYQLADAMENRERASFEQVEDEVKKRARETLWLVLLEAPSGEAFSSLSHVMLHAFRELVQRVAGRQANWQEIYKLGWLLMDLDCEKKFPFEGILNSCRTGNIAEIVRQLDEYERSLNQQ